MRRAKSEYVLLSQPNPTVNLNLRLQECKNHYFYMAIPFQLSYIPTTLHLTKGVLKLPFLHFCVMWFLWKNMISLNYSPFHPISLLGSRILQKQSIMLFELFLIASHLMEVVLLQLVLTLNEMLKLHLIVKL